jgi:hypothetical protein
MANAKYVELVVKEQGMPKHYLSGYVIVSDHRSSGSRHLFLKRGQDEAKPDAPVKKRQRKPRSNSQPQPSPATSFPGGDVRTA